MTAKRVMPRARAVDDVVAAVDHDLENAVEKTALGFVNALEHAYRHIACYPSSGSPRYALESRLPGLDSWPVAGYPHIIFYVDRGDHIDVWRVLHGKRDIPVWLCDPD